MQQLLLLLHYEVPILEKKVVMVLLCTMCITINATEEFSFLLYFYATDISFFNGTKNKVEGRFLDFHESRLFRGLIS